jgi:hypothetical protein
MEIWEKVGELFVTGKRPGIILTGKSRSPCDESS